MTITAIEGSARQGFVERRRPPGSKSVTDLVTGAAAGDDACWNELVDRFTALVRAVARGFRLSDGDAADVSQTTWLRLVEHIDRLDEPHRVGAWLATTARRECLHVLEAAGRQVPVAEVDLVAGPEPEGAGADGALLAKERAALVRQALSQLPDRGQQLLALLMLDPPRSYEEISEALHIPVGSIGPTRRRCLHKLQESLASEGIPY